ncbi:MAG: hypothetical protein QM749_19770 [Aquabacterium sp.]
MTRKKSTTQQPLTLDADTGRPVDPPPSSSINLHDIAAVRREMARVYRDMRGRLIDSQDGTRLVYVLVQILKAHESCDLEQRIKQLESKP